jgi:hypothetical protein
MVQTHKMSARSGGKLPVTDPNLYSKLQVKTF